MQKLRLLAYFFWLSPMTPEQIHNGMAQVILAERLATSFLILARKILLLNKRFADDILSNTGARNQNTFHSNNAAIHPNKVAVVYGGFLRNKYGFAKHLIHHWTEGARLGKVGHGKFNVLIYVRVQAPESWHENFCCILFSNSMAP